MVIAETQASTTTVNTIRSILLMLLDILFLLFTMVLWKASSKLAVANYACDIKSASFQGCPVLTALLLSDPAAVLLFVVRLCSCVVTLIASL